MTYPRVKTWAPTTPEDFQINSKIAEPMTWLKSFRWTCYLWWLLPICNIPFRVLHIKSWNKSIVLELYTEEHICLVTNSLHATIKHLNLLVNCELELYHKSFGLPSNTNLNSTSYRFPKGIRMTSYMECSFFDTKHCIFLLQFFCSAT